MYAPRADEVKLLLFDEKEEFIRETPMQKNGRGEWVYVLEDDRLNQRYQYRINGQVKIDPYGRSHTFSSGEKNRAYSVVSDASFDWSDAEWMEQRNKDEGKPKPMSIFELHPTTWKMREGRTLNYRELTEELIEHCKKVGYTHVEPMGILEHFYEGSWGYQVSGYFAPNSRLGSVDDFKQMVNKLHENGIGVILDWVPAHFAKDKNGLANFDGSSLYEASGIKYQASVRKNFFSYGSKHFDFSKKEVRDFLISSAFFWLDEMHVDGLRVDCVRSMLNSEDQKSANQFMRDLNSVVHEHCPGALTIAEEYSGDVSVTRPIWFDGLGFDMKWHVAWMKGSLEYFSTNPKKRSAKYEMLKKTIQSDNFHKQIMALSHDQCVSDGVINLTPGLSGKEKLCNLKSMLSFMMCLPGKKLLFMGSDSGNESSWKDTFSNQTSLSDSSVEKKELQKMMLQLNMIYRNNKEMWELDDNGYDLEWIKDSKKTVHAYRRKSSDGKSCVCLHNFTDRESIFEVNCSLDGKLHPVEIFNSDHVEYGGSGALNPEIQLVASDKERSYKVKVSPLTTIIIQEGE